MSNTNQKKNKFYTFLNPCIKSFITSAILFSTLNTLALDANKNSASDNKNKSKYNPLTKCYGTDQWICIEPSVFIKGSIGDGHNTPLNSNIQQSQMGLSLESTKTNWALVLNWSATAVVLRDSVQKSAETSVYGIREFNTNKVDMIRKSTITAKEQELSQALIAAGLAKDSAQYTQRYNFLHPVLIEKVDTALKPYYDKINHGTAEALKRIEERSNEQELRLSGRDIFISNEDEFSLFRVGWTRVGQGFNSSPLGSKMLNYTGTGSHALSVEPGTQIQSVGMEAGKKLKINNTMSVELVAWVNRDGALFVNGTQYLSNSFRTNDDLYKYYNDNIFVINAGGAKSCISNQKSETELCMNVQATNKGVSPGLQLDQNITEKLKLFVATTYVNHSLQAEGLHGRVQLTYDAFHLPYNFDVYVSVFAEYSKKQQDYSKISELDLHSDGIISEIKEAGTSIIAVKQLPKMDTTTSFGIEAKGTEFKIGEATIKDGQVVATFGVNYGSSN